MAKYLSRDAFADDASYAAYLKQIAELERGERVAKQRRDAREQQDALLQLLREGVPLDEACRQLSISEHTGWAWVDRDPYVHLQWRRIQIGQIIGYVPDTPDLSLARNMPPLPPCPTCGIVPTRSGWVAIDCSVCGGTGLADEPGETCSNCAGGGGVIAYTR